MHLTCGKSYTNHQVTLDRTKIPVTEGTESQKIKKK